MTEQCEDCVFNIGSCEHGLFPQEGFDCPEFKEITTEAN